MLVQYVSVGILVNEKKEVLLEKNNSNPNFKGLWQFPGGKVEPNETPKEALIREMQEELDIKFDTESTIIPLCFNEYTNGDDKTMVVLFYICKNWNGEISPKVNQDIQWINNDDLEKMAHLPYNHAVIHKIHDEI